MNITPEIAYILLVVVVIGVVGWTKFGDPFVTAEAGDIKR